MFVAFARTVYTTTINSTTKTYRLENAGKGESFRKSFVFVTRACKHQNLIFLAHCCQFYGLCPCGKNIAVS